MFYFWNTLVVLHSSELRFLRCLPATTKIQKSIIKDVLTVLPYLDVSRETTLLAYVGSPIHVYGLTALSQFIEQGGKMELLVE